MKVYKFPQDHAEVGKLFRQYFKTQPDEYFDPLLGFLTRSFVIDIIKLDELMHARHGDYDEGPDAISMSDLIIREYGSDARDFIDSLLGADETE